jgi:hypothetical protein
MTARSRNEKTHVTGPIAYSSPTGGFQAICSIGSWAPPDDGIAALRAPRASRKGGPRMSALSIRGTLISPERLGRAV